jgi:hypothetical protein
MSTRCPHGNSSPHVVKNPCIHGQFTTHVLSTTSEDNTMVAFPTSSNCMSTPIKVNKSNRSSTEQEFGVYCSPCAYGYTEGLPSPTNKSQAAVCCEGIYFVCEPVDYLKSSLLFEKDMVLY